ncbi:hypothetical protein [Myxosarcina sp. GI1]|uniref:hypothetical protein n=1 Tax=Myxosarcina sp. GI1 TaxID=1541065 RepID=UPI00055E1814|nr:hypothetical protein [Myxosarcina sp. GI1]
MRLKVLPFSFELNTVAIAGACLWSLALYISFPKIKNWITKQLTRWFNFAERSLYTPEEYEATRQARESQNEFYASVLSIVPFIILGAITYWSLDLSFDSSSWAISLGIITCMISGIFALGSLDS